jgi:acetaldehyde dehydrogenase / alcohol dehydrogenase
MTIGTGFFGRSSLTENLEPRNLTQWTRVAYATDAPFGDVAGLQPWEARPEPAPVERSSSPADNGLSRDELRALILEELQELVRS